MPSDLIISLLQKARTMEPIRVLAIMGTRPEAIKMEPLIHQLREHRSEIETCIIVTGQHRSMAGHHWSDLATLRLKVFAFGTQLANWEFLG